MASAKGIFPYSKAFSLSILLCEWLLGGGQRGQVCGSIRRKCKLVGDIDMVVSGPMEVALSKIEFCSKSSRMAYALLSGNSGKKKSATFLLNGVQVNMYVASTEEWGAMILFLTGSKLFNIVMRGKAKALGYKLNQYGLYHGVEVIAGRSEEQIFEAMGLEFIPPERRDIKGNDRVELKERR